MSRRWRAQLPRLLRRAAKLAVVALALAVALIALAAALTPFPEELRSAGRGHRATPSRRIFDRRGDLVAEVRGDDSMRAVEISRADLGEVSIAALVAAEDGRFYGHGGVDPVAVVRAAASNLRSGHVVSGASTITMQLARLLRPHPRTFRGKFSEMLLALRIEATLEKDDILTAYANRAPFGPTIRGLRAASLAYFDKEPSELSVGEAAALAAIPKGPSAYDPYRHPDRVLARKALVVARMASLGFIGPDTRRVAEAEPVAPLVSAVKGRPQPTHFARALLGGALGPRVAEGAPDVLTTLDSTLQRQAEVAVRSQVRALADRHVTAGAVLVADNATGDILAYVGSPDPFDRERGGYNDGVVARRQAGSTLKPFLYGLAFDRNVIDAASWLPDVPLTLPLRSGAFVPANYDGAFHGPIRARVALANSLNVPAVALVERVGVGDFLAALHAAGFALADSAEHYGAALALGDGEVTLFELVRAYLALARGGDAVPIHAVTTSPEAPLRIMSPESAWLVADILADHEARLSSFGEDNVFELPFRASVKTGTSKGFHDNWAIGFTRRITVGVWVGNFDGSSMQGVSGVAGAGPILRSILLAAEQGPAEPRDRELPTGFERARVCALSGQAPGDDCPNVVSEWLPGSQMTDRPRCTMHTHALIDRRTGGLASSRTEARDRERRTFEVMPPALEAWARAAHRPRLPAAGEVQSFPRAATDEEAHSEGSRVYIEHPSRDTRYYLDPTRPRTSQAIGVRVRSREPASTIALRVDGREVARGTDGQALEWIPEKGRHELVAVAGRDVSRPVEVVVE